MHDVINFHDDSAGGADALQDVVGSDGTEAFEYAGHSADAVQNLEGLTFGVFADSHVSFTAHSFSPAKSSSAIYRKL